MLRIGATVLGLALVIGVQGSRAQQYPPGMKWAELSTPRFRVIYPAEIETDAQRVAATLEAIYGRVAKTLDAAPSRLPVVLNNRSTDSNGYVTLAPRRTVWESTPFFPGLQSLLGPGEWYDLLAVHEFRHVVQFARMNRGMSRLARIVYGENGLLASASSSAPRWFWEGDAVGLETALTRSGRGRIPAFDMHHRAMLAAGKRFALPKSQFRSYRDFLPGLYPYGYLVTTHVRREYGSTSWSEIVARSASWSIVPLMFPISVKRTTGRGLHRLHREAMEDYALHVQEQLDGLEITSVTPVSPTRKRRWTNYAHPHYAGAGRIVAVRSGLRESADLVILDQATGGAHKLRTVDRALYFGGFDANDTHAVWSQSRIHPRFSSDGYAVLMSVDLQSGSERAITRRTQLFKPAISVGGDRIAAVEYSQSRESSIVILDFESGNEVVKFSLPDSPFVSEVAWTRNDDAIVAVVQGAEGKSIVEIRLADYSQATILPSSFENVWGIVDGGDFVYYVSDFSGIDNIYALKRESGDVWQVTSRPFGAYFPEPSADGARLAFSDYTVDGFDVVEVAADPSSWTSKNAVESRHIDYHGPIVAQEGGDALVPGSTVPKTDFPTRRYRRLRDAISFHSWEPVYDGRVASFLLTSNNLLNTLGLQLGAAYDSREQTLLGVAAASYSGTWPVLSVRGSTGGRADSYTTSSGEEVTYSWRESGGRVGVSLPLTFLRGTHATSLVFAVSGGLFEISDREFVPFLDPGNGLLSSVGASFSLSQRHASAFADFLPPRAFSFYVSAQTTTTQSEFKSRQLYGSASLIGRGLAPQHRIRLVTEAEAERPDNYRFSSVIRYSRGYGYRYADNVARASAEYLFPLAYPDISIGNFFYTPRLIASFFYDHTWARADGSSFSAEGDFNSVGAELSMEAYVFSLPVPVQIGVRVAYRIPEQELEIDPLFFSVLLN